MSESPRIDILYFDAGSGHRSAAKGLVKAIEQDHPVRARAVDVLDVIAGHRLFHRTVRAGIDHFNGCLRREKVRDLKGLINLSLLSHDLVSRRGVRAIAEFWTDDAPAAVLSVTPMYNPVLARALRAARPGAPYLVLPVDMEEGKPRYWFDPRTGADYLLTGARQRQQALEAGIPPERLHELSGMVIDPEFYAPPPADRRAALDALGLDPARPTGVVSFGGQGSVLVERCVAALEKVDRPLNVIALCGRDAGVRERVEALPTRHRRLVLGFAPQPPVHYLHLADFAVGKPGSMTIVEAVVTETPILAIRAGGMWVVQRGNERWVEERGAGAVVPTPESLPACVERVLDDPGMRERLRTLRHEAVFEAAARTIELAGIARAPGRPPRPGRESVGPARA